VSTHRKSATREDQKIDVCRTDKPIEAFTDDEGAAAVVSSSQARTHARMNKNTKISTEITLQIAPKKKTSWNMHGSFENNLRKCKSGHEQRVRNGRHARVKHVFPGGVRRRDSISCASQRLLAQ
jgi:hypothetical protein